MRLNPLLAALALLGLSVGPTFASQTAVHYPFSSNVIADVRLRAGPGSVFPQIDLIPRGNYVEVTGCQNGFCHVWRGGNEPEGWVHSDYLIFP
jgi:uncharacterized protein YraI